MRRIQHVSIFNPIMKQRSTLNSSFLAPDWSTQARRTGNTVTNMANVAKEAIRMLCFAGKAYSLLVTLILITVDTCQIFVFASHCIFDNQFIHPYRLLHFMMFWSNGAAMSIIATTLAHTAEVNAKKLC